MVQVGGQLRIPAALSSKISLRYPLNRRPSGPQRLSGGSGVEKCLERTEHLVMSRTCNKGVTDWLTANAACKFNTIDDKLSYFPYRGPLQFSDEVKERV
jgi:hypothetical protein